MKQTLVSTLSKMLVALFVFVLGYYLFLGVTTTPHEGDSLAYHIPIAKSVLTGAIFYPVFDLGFYPSNGEVLLSLFLALHIPLNLFNVLAIAIVFLLCFFVGKTYKLSTESSLLFAVSVCLLHTMLRWALAQIIDIWLLNFFLTTLLLLEHPKKSTQYVLFLGISVGLLIGVKYSGFLFAGVLLLVFGKKLREILSPFKLLLFLLPIILLGFSWFMRNFFLMGNPLYPQASFLFSKAPSYWNILHIHVWEAVLHKPVYVFNALIDEFLLWPIISMFMIIIACAKHMLWQDKMIRKLLVLALACFLFFVLLPTNYEYNIIVSSFRYAYPGFVLLFLCGFLIAQKLHLELLFGLFTLASVLVMLIHPYHPKILFFVLPLIAVCYASYLFIEQIGILD